MPFKEHYEGFCYLLSWPHPLSLRIAHALFNISLDLRILRLSDNCRILLREVYFVPDRAFLKFQTSWAIIYFFAPANYLTPHFTRHPVNLLLLGIRKQPN